MKKFIAGNWYKLMIGSSLLMASFAFMVFSVNSVTAKSPAGTYSTIPVNADGSITIKLSDEQLKALKPSAVQAVNIAEINGREAGLHWSYNLEGTAYYALDVSSSN